MNRDQKNQVANLILDRLQGKYYHESTSSLYSQIKHNLPGWCSQAHLRQILNILRQKGTIERLGGEHAGAGKHKWKSLVSTWDRLSPLGVQKGRTAIEKSDDDEDDTPEDETVSTLPEGIDEDPAENEDDKPHEPSTNLLKEELIGIRRRVKTLEENQGITETNHTTLATEMDRLEASIKELAEQSKRSVRTIKIEKWDGTVVKLKDAILPAQFDKVLDLAKCRRNILLVGPAGCGKSFLAELVAKSLGLIFYKVGGSGGLSETHLLGKCRPNLTNGKDKFLTTQFLTAYEDGGLCLVDELDGADANVLLALNPALDATGHLPVPNRDSKPVANKHGDFVCVGTANTIGRGATRQYMGRNELDESTLDRFRIGIVECDYDPIIDASVCPDDELRNWCTSIREKINQYGMRRIMSTRFMADAYIMRAKADWSVDQCKDAFIQGWTREEKSRIGH